MESDFKQLIKHYADGCEICNCGDAYYKNCGQGYVDGHQRFDLPVCEHGCGPNQIRAKEYIASRVVADFRAMRAWDGN